MSEGIETILGDVLEFKKGNFICLSARPGMGKTSLALQIAMEYAKNSGETVYILSLDLTAEEVYLRMACTLGEVDVLSAQRGTLGDAEKERIEQATAQLKQMDIIIDDPLVLSASQAVLRIEKLEYVGMVVIDDGRGLLPTFDKAMPLVFKHFCERKHIPLLYTHHLTRKMEKRRDKHPRLEDLEDMPTLVREADTILFLHRDAYYSGYSRERGIAQIIIAKNRYDNPCTVLCGWNSRFMKFSKGISG